MLSLAYKSFMLGAIVLSVAAPSIALGHETLSNQFMFNLQKYVSTSVGPSPSKLPQLGPISRKMSLPIQGKGLLFFRRVNDGAGWTRRRPTRRQANWSTANSSKGL